LNAAIGWDDHLADNKTWPAARPSSPAVREILDFEPLQNRDIYWLHSK